MDLSLPETVLIIILAAAVFIQLLYYWLLFARLAFFRPKKAGDEELPPVSVVLVARNEYSNLKQNLPQILEQEYEDFEVVVVNHISDDETAELLEDLQKKYARLKVVNIAQDLNFFKGKKFPLSIGIKSAAHDVLLLTDADCRPESKHWIRAMAGNYRENKQIVLGYGPYRKEKGLVNLFIRYDTFMVALQYLSYALAGVPYMGVGRNLSYTRSLFLRNKGFTAHYRVASGDDDLFISQVATRKNTVIEVSPESFVYSEPKRTFREWFRQKQRHLTTGKFYKPKIKFLLGLFSFTQLLFFALIITLFVISDRYEVYYILAGLFLIRFISQMIVQKKVTDLLREKQLLIFSPLLEVFYILLVLVLFIKSIFVKHMQWK